MLRLGSVIRFSMSTLQPDTAAGWTIDSLFSDLMAANLSTGLGDERNNWKTLVNEER